MKSQIKAAVTVAEMATMVKLSRDRFYDLVRRRVFPPAVYSIRTRRPYYPAELQEICMDVRASGIAFSGEPVTFNRITKRRSQFGPSAKTSGDSKGLRILLGRLKYLGLSCLTLDSLDQALTKCFPKGIGSETEAEVLRGLLRHLTQNQS